MHAQENYKALTSRKYIVTPSVKPKSLKHTISLMNHLIYIINTFPNNYNGASFPTSLCDILYLFLLFAFHFKCFLLPDFNFVVKADTERYPKNSNDQDKSSERNVACKYNPEQYQQSFICVPLFWTATFIAIISNYLYSPHNPFPAKNDKPLARSQSFRAEYSR